MQLRVCTNPRCKLLQPVRWGLSTDSPTSRPTAGTSRVSIAGECDKLARARREYASTFDTARTWTHDGDDGCGARLDSFAATKDLRGGCRTPRGASCDVGACNPAHERAVHSAAGGVPDRGHQDPRCRRNHAASSGDSGCDGDSSRWPDSGTCECRHASRWTSSGVEARHRGHENDGRECHQATHERSRGLGHSRNTTMAVASTLKNW